MNNGSASHCTHLGRKWAQQVYTSAEDIPQSSWRTGGWWKSSTTDHHWNCVCADGVAKVMTVVCPAVYTSANVMEGWRAEERRAGTYLWSSLLFCLANAGSHAGLVKRSQSVEPRATLRSFQSRPGHLLATFVHSVYLSLLLLRPAAATSLSIVVSRVLRATRPQSLCLFQQTTPRPASISIVHSVSRVSLLCGSFFSVFFFHLPCIHIE